jgi:polyisoprenoid-binding protein YceI
MKKVILPLVFAFSALSFIIFSSIEWSTDASHSRLGFTIKHMGITDVNGEFKKFDVVLKTPNGDLSGASIDMTAETTSINTGIEMRDNHLKTADFFDVTNHPTISFKSTSVTKLKGSEFKVIGDLTMKGITRSVTLTAAHNGTVKNEAGKSVAGFKLTGLVKRSDFGVGQPSAGLSDEVKLLCDLEVVQN